MKLPRDIDAGTLIKVLQRIGYRVVRQSGSHVRLFSEAPNPHALTAARALAKRPWRSLSWVLG